MTTAEPKFGAWISSPSAVAAEQVAREPFDYVCIDGQHGLLSYAETRDALIAITAGGGTPFVRVVANSAAEIGRMLDAGARGIIVPLVNSAAEAEQAARAARYPVSDGGRSWGPTRLGEHFSGSPADVDAGVTLLVMIETRQALADVEAILDVPGVEGVYVGPYDLSLALGASAPFEDEVVAELDTAIERVRIAARARGKIAGIHCADGATAARRAAEGFTFVTAATDMLALRAGLRGELAAARSQA